MKVYRDELHAGREMAVVDPLSLESNCTIEIPLKECDGETEQGCFSSFNEFRLRVWEFFARCKYILCW